MIQIKQSSAAQALVFLMIDSADHVTGKQGLTVTVTISKNGGAFVTPSGAVSEISSGLYKVAPNATDSNTAGPLILHATASGADPTDKEFMVVAFDPLDAVRLGMTALPNATAAANGGLPTVDANNNVHGLQSRTVSDTSVIGSGTSTYAGGDTTGVTTLLARIGSALNINAGKVAATLAPGDIADIPTTRAARLDFLDALISSIPASTEGHLMDETDGQTLLASIVARINATDVNLAGLSTTAIASAVWSFLSASATTSNSIGAMLVGLFANYARRTDAATVGGYAAGQDPLTLLASMTTAIAALQSRNTPQAILQLLDVLSGGTGAAPKSLAADIANAIDSRIAGKTASVALPIYSDLTTGTLNPSCYLGSDVDKSHICWKITGNDSRYGVTLIDPHWGDGDGHEGLGVIGEIHWFGNGGFGVVSAIFNGGTVGKIDYSADRRLFYYAVAVTGAVPCAVVDPSWLAKLPNSGVGVPIIRIDQQRRAYVAELSTPLNADEVFFAAPTNAQRLAFFAFGIDKDSSHGWFFLNGNKMCMLASSHSASAGPSVLFRYKTMVAAMKSVRSDSAPLTFDVSSYDDQQAPNPFITFASITSFDATGLHLSAGSYGSLLLALTDGAGDPTGVDNGEGYVSINPNDTPFLRGTLQSVPVPCRRLQPLLSASIPTLTNSAGLYLNLFVNGVNKQSFTFGYGDPIPNTLPPYVGNILPTDVVEYQIDVDASGLTLPAKLFEFRVEYTPGTVGANNVYPALSGSLTAARSALSLPALATELSNRRLQLASSGGAIPNADAIPTTASGAVDDASMNTIAAKIWTRAGRTLDQGTTFYAPSQQFGSRIIVQGDDYGPTTRPMIVAKRSNTDWPADLTGATLSFTASRDVDNQNAGAATLVGTVTVVTATGDSRAVTVSLPTSVTSTASAGVYSYAVRAIIAGKTWTLELGTLDVRT